MTQLDFIKHKICTREEAAKRAATLQKAGKKLVFTNGCFDLLHQGHVDYLSKARDLGDVLVIGVNTDASVRVLGKGNSRPIQDEYSRSLILAALSFVDMIVLFGEPTPLELIRTIGPDVLVKGADWSIDKIVGKDVVEARGGLVTTIPLISGFSTTAIEKKILDSAPRSTKAQ